MEDVDRQIEERREDEQFKERLRRRHESERELYERLDRERVIRNPRFLSDVDVAP